MLEKMMSVNKLLFLWKVLCFTISDAHEVTTTRKFLGESLANMVFLDEKIYIGAKDYIYVLNETYLSNVHDRVSTCTEGLNCDNHNKVLMPNKELGYLITCGTGNSGICEMRNLSDVNQVLSTTVKDLGDKYLVVSTNLKRPAIFVLVPGTGTVYTGVTYGAGVAIDNPTPEANSYSYFLADYVMFPTAFADVPERQLRLNLPALPGINDIHNYYLVYIKAGFSYNGFTYFVTNQKFSVSTAESYISKIIRVCQNDSDFYSFTDVVLKCETNNVQYTLVQDVSVFTPGKKLRQLLGVSDNEKIMIASFASGSDPESPGVPSAVCLYKLSTVDSVIIDAKKIFLSESSNRLDESNRYLKKSLVKELPDVNVSLILCNDKQYIESARFIIGERSAAVASPLYSSSSDRHGSFTKIQGITVTDDELTTVLVGTSKGSIMKLNINSEVDGDVYYETTVDEGHPITAVYAKDEKVQYAMSTQKIVRYETIKCDQTTCMATMEARNPLCGWCVYAQKSTMKDNSSCPYQSYRGHWLSSLTQCLEIKVEPRGLAVGPARRVNVLFTGLTPDLISGYKYACEIRAGRNKLVYNSFTCETPPVYVHTEGKVLLYVKTPSSKLVLLAQTDLLFYDCGDYIRCGECLRDPRANCSWNSHTTKCVPRNYSSDIFIQKNGTCSSFQNNDRLYLPSGVQKILIFNVINLVNTSVSMNYSCKLNGKVFSAQRLSDSKINCTLQETTTENEAEYKLEILYGTSALDGKNTVVVYNCSKLGSDCSICRSLKYGNPNYVCDWCSGDCVHYESPCSLACGPPNVTGILPNTAGLDGNITVTIYGQEMGSHFDDVDNITLAGIACEPQREDFMPSTRVTCKAGRSGNVKGGNVTMVVNNQTSREYVRFEYKMPTVETVLPTKGPQKGGTRLTIRGQDLGIGTRMVKVNVTIGTGVNSETKECTDAEVMPKLSLNNMSNFHIECDTPASAAVDSNIEKVTVIFDGGTENEEVMNFTYKENPEMDDRDLKNIASGGINQTITGKKFGNANKGFVSMKCQNETKTQSCIIKSDTEMICEVPELCAERRNELINKSRRKRETGASGVVDVEIIIHLDGVQQTFSIFYYSDPSFNPFDEDSKVKLFESKNKKLTIRGSNLNLVAGEDDVIVTIGVGNCDVIELRETNLTCVAPTNQPAPGVPRTNFPEVNVTIGNVHGNLGYLQYVEIQEELARLWIIIAAVIGGLLALVVIIVVALLVKYKQKSKKMRDFQRHVEEQEQELKQIFREEFADMHTSMSSVNNNLIEQGCPYHHYHQYVFNVLFPADKMDSHPLLQEPVVSNKVTDEVRSRMKRGMEEFESLIYNKYFLKSVIDSLEGQRKFGLKDKANMCGYICTILLGRMEYLQEIIVELLGNLVQESAGKKNQKVLFRRCETIAEKLLSNWLSLCLYPHLKSQSGYPLYLLYKATQLHMEAGPIDAITNDAKYTLSEEKLLKKYSQTAKQGSDEPTFEAKCLTLNVVVDNCRDIKVCRVLDCDTITQVKDKCLTQIYVNYPASNLTVKPEELELEWHAGMSGSLRLRDEDNTSKKHGSWVRLNTLAHYNVQDGSNMALIDPQVADASQEQDYANLAQVQVSCPSPSECSMDSTDAVTASLVVESSDRNVRYWHIVKPEEGTLAPGKSLIAELYLNRLLTFKQSILEYVKAIYDTVLKEDVLPAHVHYLYNLLDSLAKKNNVESDILHTWKSEIYPVRIWAHLMKKPSVVFDIKSPPYVETSMDVISQVFIDCFSLEAHKFSKDSPTHKMIFSKEMHHYKERVKQFYKEISVIESQPLSLRKYLEDVNKLQQQHANFNKMSALHKLYQQIEPYMLEIIDDLANNKDACKLHLDKKLEQINGLMEEE